MRHRSYIGHWAPRALDGAPLAVIDFETTGLDTTQCSAVSVAVVHMDIGKDNAELVYSQMIDPCVEIPEVTVNIHGITNEKVCGSPTFAEQLPQLMSALDGRLLAAFHLPYDWSMLNTEYVFMRLNERVTSSPSSLSSVMVVGTTATIVAGDF